MSDERSPGKVMTKTEWFTGSGGPLVLLPENLVERWSGIDAPLDGRVVKAAGRWVAEAPATDYDFACDIEDAFALVDLGDGPGIVLGRGPFPTTFVRDDDGGVFVRWVQATTEEEILGRLDAARQAIVGPDDPVLIHAHPGPLVLFDAACPGPEVEEDRVVLDVHPGSYAISAAEYKPDPEFELILVRLARVG